MPIKSVTKTEVGGGKKEKKKLSKRIYRISQNIRIINVFLESLLSESFPSLEVTVHFTSLGCEERMPSNTVLISGPALKAAQMLLCSYAMFLPPRSAAIRTSVFSFVRAFNDLLYVPQTQSMPS